MSEGQSALRRGGNSIARAEPTIYLGPDFAGYKTEAPNPILESASLSSRFGRSCHCVRWSWLFC